MTINIIQFTRELFDDGLVYHMLPEKNEEEWQQTVLTESWGKDKQPIPKEEEDVLRLNQEFKTLAFKFGSIIYPK